MDRPVWLAREKLPGVPPVCDAPGYDRRAASLAAELKEQGFDAAIAAGRSGQFDVLADGRLVFSKHDVHRFPEPGEVLALLQS